MEREEKVTLNSIKPYAYMEELLCKASANGNLITAARILHERINPNCKDYIGRSPLHYAAMNNHFDMICLLISNQAIVNITDFNNVTPLHLAATGADYTIKCVSGCTPKDLAPYNSATYYFLEKI
ncbi:unnamed protein product [Heterobilharzia americana]|nr:unnamed protein product [Heterobilharzia americana]CAH8521033.1 unnamed protein product [Heterobilharzia americana]